MTPLAIMVHGRWGSLVETGWSESESAIDRASLVSASLSHCHIEQINGSLKLSKCQRHVVKQVDKNGTLYSGPFYTGMLESRSEGWLDVLGPVDMVGLHLVTSHADLSARQIRLCLYCEVTSAGNPCDDQAGTLRVTCRDSRVAG